MPMVKIDWIKGRDEKTKAEVAHKIVEILDKVAGVHPSSTNVLFVDHEPESWFLAYESIAEFRRKRDKK